MRSASSWHGAWAPAQYVLQAIFFSLIGIGLLLAFILLRRAYRRRYFRRFNARTLFFRRNWKRVLQGAIEPSAWLSQPLDCGIVESFLLDTVEKGAPEEKASAIEFLRSSGLLPLRLFQARHSRGWARRNVLLSLGRMEAPEAIPALQEALNDSSAETRLVAVRGLGSTRLPEAAGPIVEYFVRGLPDVAVTTALNALLRCCAARPRVLWPHIRQAGDAVRPMLVRVLGELATPDMAEDLIFLTTDSLPEVRASAARALSLGRSLVALNAAAQLAKDPEWFVRLRAVASIGEMRDPRAIPFLVGALCDENRLVRLRAAEALSRFESQLPDILRAVMRTKDEYALQAFISQIERTGMIPRLIDSLGDPAQERGAGRVLLDVLQSGSHRMLLDALLHHPQPRVREGVSRLLVRSGDDRLLPALEDLLGEEASPDHREALEDVLHGLKGQLPNREKAPTGAV